MDLKSQTTSDSQPARVVNIPADLNEVFPYKVCINLDRRAERWQQMLAKFERHDIHDVRRFAAVDGQRAVVPPNWLDTPGAYGCLSSHLEIVRDARKLGVGSVLIFEDDAAFDPQLQENFARYFPQVPADWDMLFFGAMHMDAPIEVSENVRRVRSANSTFAYALRHTIFDAFIQLNSEAQTAVDLNNRILQKAHACYCFMPHLAWVEDVSSDAQERQKYHWYLKESLVIHGCEMNRVLNQTSVIIAHRNPAGNNFNTQNLIFLARFYSERLGIGVVIVEQGAEATISAGDLPPACQYRFLKDGSRFNQARCFNAGMETAHSDHTFLIFSDSDIFVEEWDIRGQLRMAQQYDCTTGFGNLIALTGAATLNLQQNQPMLLTPWFNASDYSRSRKGDRFSRFCVFSRRGIEAAGGWDERGEDEASVILSLKRSGQLGVFESPNNALQLHRG
ncbi:MAG TPA: glycosyltransferase family 25 protein [Pyrinomonadaceae bacterium]|nr:glycosyltransferase family 25 protein [Pyrinomonadaceae bacterium]